MTLAAGADREMGEILYELAARVAKKLPRAMALAANQFLDRATLTLDRLLKSCALLANLD